MALEINEPKVVAQSQKYSFESVTIRKINTKLSAILTFGVYDESNKRIDTVTKLYTDDEFNEFWTNFNSGKFLYEELVRKEALSVTVPDSTEDDFIME